MAYLSEEELAKMNFRHLGRNALISDKASIYDPEKISIGDNVRIDDFCLLSGHITFRGNNFIGAFTLIAGGEPGVVFDQFAGAAYNVQVFSQSDDYVDGYMTAPTVPKKFKKEYMAAVEIGRHCLLGAGSSVLPGVTFAEGCTAGAMTLINKSTEPWGVYVGVPAKRKAERNRMALELEKQYLEEYGKGD